jgi:preprotein translocase subunit SecE
LPVGSQTRGRQAGGGGFGTGESMELNLGAKFETVKQFLREVKTELKKVTWPSRKDTLSGTAIVLVTVFVIAIFLGVVDSGLSNLIKMLLKRATGYRGAVFPRYGSLHGAAVVCDSYVFRIREQGETESGRKNQESQQRGVLF